MTDDEIIKKELKKDWSKTYTFRKSIIGRVRLRGVRKIMFELGIPMSIHFNSAIFTNAYCLKYHKPENLNAIYTIDHNK